MRERKKRVFFVPFILFTVYRLCFISLCSVLNTLSEYTYCYIYIYIYIYIKKHYFLHIFLQLFRAFSISLRTNIFLHHIRKHYLLHIDYQSISVNQNNIFSNILYMYHKMGVTWTYFWYTSRSPNSLQPLNHLTLRICYIVPSLSWLEKHLIFY